jgi:hypothetical protein
MRILARPLKRAGVVVKAPTFAGKTYAQSEQTISILPARSRAIRGIGANALTQSIPCRRRPSAAKLGQPPFPSRPFSHPARRPRLFIVIKGTRGGRAWNPSRACGSLGSVRRRVSIAIQVHPVFITRSRAFLSLRAVFHFENRMNFPVVLPFERKRPAIMFRIKHQTSCYSN